MKPSENETIIWLISICVSKLRLPRRSQNSFHSLRDPVHDQIRILLGDVVRRREDEKVAICPICYAASGNDRDADFRRKAFRVDRRCNLLPGWKRLFGHLILDKLDLEAL